MPSTTGGINWAQYLPTLIGAGASAAGQIYGANKQAGAIDKATQLQAQTAQQQLNATLAMYGLNRGDRAPLRAVGVNALNTLQNWKPGQQNALAPVDFSKYRPNQVDLPPQLQALTSGGGGNALAPQFGDISTQGIHSRARGALGGALGGFGAGTAVNAGIKAFASPALSAALGPATLGIVPAIGALKGLAFDNNNPDKNFATQGIERVGPWVWNTVLPSVKSGQMTPEQAEQAVNQTLLQWQQSMQSTPGFNQDVLQRSVTSQRQYLEPFFAEIQRLKGMQPRTSAGGPV